MRRSIILAAICLALSAPQVGSAAIELVANGDFSLPGLAGWTVTDQAGGSGSWFDSMVGDPTPISGFATSAASVGAAAAAGGYALTDQSGPGAHALEQSFFVPGAAASVILSFDMFVNDQSGASFVNVAGLDYTVSPNQHARVDVLSAGSGALDTGLAVLLNAFIGSDPSASNPNPFTRYVVDITAIVGAGGLFDLRFAEVDNQLFFHQGVDNVSIQFTPATVGGGDVPEPLSLVAWSALTSLGGLAACRYSRAK